MKRLLIILGVVALLAAGCGSGDVGSAGQVTNAPVSSLHAPETTTTTTIPTASSTTTPDGDGTTAPTTTTPESTQVFVDVFFVKDGEYAETVTRSVETPSVAGNAIRALISGPSGDEEDHGLSSAVPANTLLLGLTIDDGLATIDLSREFETGGGSFSMLSRLAQVVYTLTQFDSVDRVQFRIDGEPVTVFSSEGIVLDEPVTRADFTSALPIGPPGSSAGPDTWTQTDLPSIDGVPADQLGRVVLVASDDTLNVRTAAGVDNDIIGRIVPGAVVRRTGDTDVVGSSTWAEVATPAGAGWVNATYLGAVVSAGEFAGDGAVIDVLDDFSAAIAAGGDITPYVSARGLYVSHHAAPVRFDRNELAGILDDPTTYKWPSNALDVNDPEQAAELPDRTFAEAVTDKFLSAYDDADTQLTRNEPITGGNGRLPEWAIPFELQGFNYVGVHDPGDDPQYGGLDWVTWYVSIDYENGAPRIVALTLDEWSP